jgi:RNA polymerase sporulation-specific sigma factor
MIVSPDDCTDLQLLERAAHSPEAVELLAQRYTQLVRSCARPYYLSGADTEDLIQEGMIGLLSAIFHFDPSREIPFPAYAARCIRSRIISAIRAGEAAKHAPLNQALCLDDAVVPVNTQEPEDLLIARETLDESLAALQQQLSTMECQVLELYLEGCSTAEIARQLERKEKSIDNAIQRIRRKALQAAAPAKSAKSAVRNINPRCD